MVALEWLDEIERRANAATPGPLHKDSTSIYAYDYEAPKGNPVEVVWVGDSNPNCDGAYLEILGGDFELFVHARADILHLCHAVQDLIGALRSVLDADPLDPLTAHRRVYAREVLERWEHGGA